MARAEMLVLVVSNIVCIRAIHVSAGYLRQHEAMTEHHKLEGTLDEDYKWPKEILKIYNNYKSASKKCKREWTKDLGTCKQNAKFAKDCREEKEDREKVLKWCNKKENKNTFCQKFDFDTHKYEIKRAGKQEQVYYKHLKNKKAKCVTIPAKGMACCVGKNQGTCTGEEKYTLGTTYSGFFCFNSMVNFEAKDKTRRKVKCDAVEKMNNGKCGERICKNPKLC